MEAVTLGDVTIEADWFIDATEIGELLALCGAEHVTGAESRDETGEPHAAARADPLNMQPISVCFAIDHLEGEDHTIARPAGYERHSFSLTAPDPQTNRPVPDAAPQPARRPRADRAGLRQPRPRQGPLAVPPHRRARQLRGVPERHHAR